MHIPHAHDGIKPCLDARLLQHLPHYGVGEVLACVEGAAWQLVRRPACATVFLANDQQIFVWV